VTALPIDTTVAAVLLGDTALVRHVDIAQLKLAAAMRGAPIVANAVAGEVLVREDQAGAAKLMADVADRLVRLKQRDARRAPELVAAEADAAAARRQARNAKRAACT
jgi:hypothetical protein